MSVKLTGQVWDLEMRPHGKKMVLLAFADAANDDGITWIALESQRGKRDILKKCSMGIRAVQEHVSALEADGHLSRLEQKGRGCLWMVSASPANSAGLFDASPANSAGSPANSAGEPYTNHQSLSSPLRVGPPVDKCPLTGIVLPPGLSLEQWEAFLDMRFALAKKVKPYVARILLEKLSGMAKRWHPGDIVDRSTVHGWPDLYEPSDGRVTGVRPVVGGVVGEPFGGVLEADRVMLEHLDEIEDGDARAAARRSYFKRQEARNEPVGIGQLLGELPLMSAGRRAKKKKG